MSNINLRHGYVTAPSPRAEKRRAVKSKKAPTAKKEALRFDAFADSYLETKTLPFRSPLPPLDELSAAFMTVIIDD